MYLQTRVSLALCIVVLQAIELFKEYGSFRFEVECRW
jgi:hypothetical protein